MRDPSLVIGIGGFLTFCGTMGSVQGCLHKGVSKSGVPSVGLLLAGSNGQEDAHASVPELCSRVPRLQRPVDSRNKTKSLPADAKLVTSAILARMNN